MSYESEDGKELINKYNIKTIPTVIIAKEARGYPGFIEAFKEVGTEEDDGTFVFREGSYFGEGAYLTI